MRLLPYAAVMLVLAIGGIAWRVALTPLASRGATAETQDTPPALNSPSRIATDSPLTPLSIGLDLRALLAAAAENDSDHAFALLQTAARRRLEAKESPHTGDPGVTAKLRLLAENFGEDDPLEIVEAGSGPSLNWIWFTARDMGRNRSALLVFLDSDAAVIDVMSFVVESAAYEGAEELTPVLDAGGDAAFFTFTSRVGGTGVSYSQWCLLRCPVRCESGWQPPFGVFDGMRHGYAGSWLIGGLADALRDPATNTGGAEREEDDELNYHFSFTYKVSWRKDSLLVRRRGCFDCAGERRPSTRPQRNPANIQLNELWRFDPQSGSLVPAF